MTNFPHVPAAFINAIAEEGTKDEAIGYLQKQWNENCAVRASLRDLLTWVDGLPVKHPQQDEQRRRAHEVLGDNPLSLSPESRTPSSR